jgi:hypothetical protein
MAIVQVPLNKKYGRGKGLFALIDECDLSIVSRYNWRARFNHKNVYAVTGMKIEGKLHGSYPMHKLIMGGIVVDHKDNNGLNNVRINLRPCSNQQNQANCTISKNKKISLKGVYLGKYNKFESKIMVNGKSIWLGRFSDPKDAALAYDIAALQYFGEFARTNEMMGLV